MNWLTCHVNGAASVRCQYYLSQGEEPCECGEQLEWSGEAMTDVVEGPKEPDPREQLRRAYVKELTAAAGVRTPKVRAAWEAYDDACEAARRSEARAAKRRRRS